MQSAEGLNQMIYNRCVGTRYCANNCPFKVRRFNWLTYAHEPAANLALNPDVVVRTRGVMEKCSFCVQRIHGARWRARMEGRDMTDGDVQTACQQSCPTQAITFGDLNDGASEVARRRAEARAYRLLEETNVEPVVHYLTRIRNREEG
jgi:molybdopterin-containing oxidoreductase family iron-sulfur binding subunit